MSVTSGFFNSLNHDRLYDAEQLSSIFDGIIKDGVYMSYKDALMVKASDPANMTVIVGEGRAWFDHTWTLNDADLPLIIDTADVVLNRIDTIVIDVDATEDVRACTIIVVKGTPASQAVAPTLINETDHHQYPLCDISIPSSSTSITQAQITNRIGTSDCPFVTGIIETIDIDDLVTQWQAQWNDWMTDRADSMDSWTAEQQQAFTTWFQTVQDTLDEDTAGNLYNMITQRTGINATATYTSGVVAITAPTDAAIITFLAPSDFLETDTYTLNGTSINITDLNNEPIEEAWKEDSPVTLTISAGKAFFKAGGAKKLPDNLPPLNPNFALEVQPSGTSIIVTADKLLASLETSMLAGGVWVAKQSSVPTDPDDGTQIKKWARNDLIYYGTPGVALSTLPEGTIVKINENGSPVEFYVAKHDYESGLNGAGRTLLVRKNTLSEQMQWTSSNYNAWGTSALRSWLNSTYLSYFESDVQSLIGSTTYYYTVGNGNTSVSSRADAVFALSLTEYGASSANANIEGSTLPIAATLQQPTPPQYNYWSRTPATNVTYYVFLCSTSADSGTFCTNNYGVRPIFTIPSTTLFLDNEDGTYVLASGAQTAAAGDTDETVSWTFDWPADTPCYVRQYTYNYKGQYQTMLEGAVVSTEDGPAYSAVLAENTWSMIAQACVDNDPIVDQWLVGDSKDETISGEVLTFVILGKDHDDKSDGTGKAKLTFGMKDCMAQKQYMQSDGGVETAGSFVGSWMYATYLTGIYNNLPEELKNAIVSISKKTAQQAGNSSIRTDAMNLWLLSGIEIFGDNTYTYPGEGTQYDYYATAANRVKRLSNGAGNADAWWTRSPLSSVYGSGTPFGFMEVDRTGGQNNSMMFGTTGGVSFNFCIG